MKTENELMTLPSYTPANRSTQVKHLDPETESNDEYISLCAGTIVYRNMYSTNIHKFVKDLAQRGHRLLLLRQRGYTVQLLWTGTIPQQYQIRRQPVTITVDKVVYDVLSSLSIEEER
jgi:hypothetical protein